MCLYLSLLFSRIDYNTNEHPAAPFICVLPFIFPGGVFKGINHPEHVYIN